MIAERQKPHSDKGSAAWVLVCPQAKSPCRGKKALLQGFQPLKRLLRARGYHDTECSVPRPARAPRGGEVRSGPLEQRRGANLLKACDERLGLTDRFVRPVAGGRAVVGRQHVRATDEPRILRRRDPEPHQLLQVVAVGAAGVLIVDVGKPLPRRRYVGELVQFRDGERARRGRSPDEYGL